MVPVTVASTTGAPGFSPRGAFQVNAQVTAPNTVTVNVCALEVLLETVRTQWEPPDEVIIADDGSRSETGELVASRAPSVGRTTTCIDS